MSPLRTIITGAVLLGYGFLFGAIYQSIRHPQPYRCTPFGNGGWICSK